MNPMTDHLPPCTRCDNQRLIKRKGSDGAWKATLCHCVGACPTCDGNGDYMSAKCLRPECKGVTWTWGQRREIETPCPTCNTSGYVYCDPCPTCSPYRIHVRNLNLGKFPNAVDPSLPDHALSAEQVAVMPQIEDYIEAYKPGGRGLYIWSANVGTGKTRIVQGVALEISTRHSLRLASKTCKTLWSEMYEAMDESQGRAEAILRRLSAVPLLFLEEMVAPSTEWKATAIATLLHDRHAAMRTTWMTSNLSLEQFRDSLGDAGAPIFSRLAEFVTVIELGGPDIRQQETGL